MRGQLNQYLHDEADKHIARYMSNLRSAAQRRQHYQRTSGQQAHSPARITPRRWALDQQFDPFYVRRHADSISHALASRIRAGKYSPRPSLKMRIPKPTGGTREIAIFTVVDSAVSRWLFDSLARRNDPGFSNYAYAYRIGRNAQHALEHIAAALARNRRAYILEYDFAKYFDSVRHDYLETVISGSCKARPPGKIAHLGLFEARLRKFCQRLQGWRVPVFSVGFPQGTTISLFLANMACLELDREIERSGASFARFADDTIIVCDDYNTAHRLAGIMIEHGKRSGAEINLMKSPGISLVADPARAELKAKESLPSSVTRSIHTAFSRRRGRLQESKKLHLALSTGTYSFIRSAEPSIPYGSRRESTGTWSRA